MSPAAHLAVGAVRAYQWTIRPLIGANCRFWPSCSDYAVEAVREHGAVRGSALAGWRILRCNPWCQGGYDPVPAGAHHGGGQADKRRPSSVSAGVHNVRPPALTPDPTITISTRTAGGHDHGKSH